VEASGRSSGSTDREATPRWEAAAQRLVSALAAQPDRDARCRLLDRVATRLRTPHYLGFVQLLCAVERFGDGAARRIVADALADALESDRLPSGTVAAWGAPSFRSAAALGVSGASLGSGGRRLGPIEFLCAALLQPGVQPAASLPDADFALQRMIALVNASPRAAALYAARLQSHAADPLEGALSQRTRGTLQALGAFWQAGESPERIVRRALATGLAPPR
jgi:hypothetical protein